MKTLLITFVLLGSFSSIAKEKCSIDVMLAVVERDSTNIIVHRNTTNSYVKYAESWEECYYLAINVLTNDFNESYPLVDGNDEYTGYTFARWRYNDKFIFDTSGMVTIFTGEFENDPVKGDYRYCSNGFLFN